MFIDILARRCTGWTAGSYIVIEYVPSVGRRTSMRVTRVRREIVRVLMLVAITSLVPLPVRADDTPSQQPAPTIKASAAAIVARDVAAVPVRGARVRRADQGTTSTTGSTSFFKTRPG